MSGRIAIAGGGIAGRLVALEAMARGWRVTLFDRGQPSGEGSAAYVAAGLLDPVGTLEDAPRLVGRLGLASLERLPAILSRLPRPVPFGRDGSLAVAPPADAVELEALADRIRRRDPSAPIEEVRSDRLRALEPELDSRFQRALFLPTEGWVHTRAMLLGLAEALERGKARLVWGSRLTRVEAREVATDEAAHSFDVVVDCRGLGARPALSLRGVRGELVLVRAPSVRLGRPVRLLHPRHPIYVVPRGADCYAIGATVVEAEDTRPMTVRGALELLSSAFALHSGLGEAEIVECLAQCRPALADNVPRIVTRGGVFHLNGLFRHGFLASPALALALMDRVETGRAPDPWQSLFEEIL